MALSERFTVRGRTTLAATIVVGLALVAAAAVLTFSVRLGFESPIERAARSRAADVARIAQTAGLPIVLPGASQDLRVQVVADGTRVVSRAAISEDQKPFIALNLPPGAIEVRTLTALDGRGVDVHADALAGATVVTGEPAANAVVAQEPWLVVAQGIETSSGPRTILVAATLASVQASSNVLVPLLGLGIPLMLLIVAGTTWALTGVALRPVDSMRADADAISASALERRLPVPAARDEVRDLAETMNRLLDRIEAASLRQHRFTSDASHELKSPVAAIRTMAEVALRDPANADARELLEDILAEDARLEALVSDLLLLARSDEGRLATRPEPTDLAPIIEEEARLAAKSETVKMDLRIAQGLVAVVDAERVGRLLRNLLDNAVRHARSQVRVEARRESLSIVVDVSDDGAGVDRDQREHVFERFVRLDDGRSRSQGGTGLGLAVARAIARAYGGDVSLVDSPAAGATFRVRLPRA